MPGILDQINQASTDLNTRYSQRLKGKIKKGSIDEARMLEDQRRIQLVDTLRTIAADPSRTAAFQEAGASQFGLDKLLAEQAASQATGRATLGAASRGLLGGSAHRAAKGRIAGARDTAVEQAALAADDFTTQATAADDANLSAQLTQILDPTQASAAAEAAANQAANANANFASMRAQNNNQFSQALAQALGGFISQGVTPNVQALSNYTTQQNQLARDNWMLDRQEYGAAGAGARPVNRSPWQTLWGENN